MKFRIVLTLLVGFGACAASAHADPLKFKAWKEQQIVEAQNEVLRISARLHSQKTTPKAEKPGSADAELIGNHRFQTAPEVTDRDLKMAQETLEISKEFTIEDYAEVYVSGLQEDSDQFAKLMNSLSKDEITQLMKILVKNKPADSPHPINDAKHNKTATPPTLASSAPRA